MTKKILFTLTGGLFLSAALTAVAQDTPIKTATPTTTKTTTTKTTTPTETTTTKTTVKTEVVQNPDGTYSVIEYPVGKEVIVELTPNADMNTARGTARVMRMDKETTVNFDLSGFTEKAASYYAYAVDPSGAVTYLGPITSENGMAKGAFTTPLSQFMLVLSPTENLTTIGNDTQIMFRSAVPAGSAIIPNRTLTGSGKIDENLKAVSTDVNAAYQVPLLGIPKFKKGTTEIKIDFSGELEGLKGKAYIVPRSDGSTQIKMRFDDMKMSPKDKRFVLWAVSADNKYTKIGQVINTGERQEGEIRSETALNDFGLLVTVEDIDVEQPTSKIYSIFRLNP